ncbi:ATPase family gene 2 protein homolog B [Topomyia yanbarensis]|uniref:ATPase family gene 2 protein homolog B n=1 Tax=Topomyia yanbarensis TaxID=2498891 RepID=UPI00273BD43E|nr:ATPase family gene 2 protein homolog B [Topomyia yanbarensis]
MLSPIPIDRQITPDSRQLFIAPQVCEISAELFNTSGRQLPVGAPVVCRFSNSDRQFLCKWFAPPDDHLRVHSVCYVDQSVELLSSLTAAAHKTEFEVLHVKDLLALGEEIYIFEKISVELRVDCTKLNLELTRDRRELAELVKDLIRTLYLSKNCIIRLDNFEDTNYGIVGVLVKSTLGQGSYGQIDSSTVLEIDDIIFTGHKSKRSTHLGGLSVSKVELQKCLKLEVKENVLLAGPSGSGKSSLIAQLAEQGNHPVFCIRGLDFVKSFPGETELELRRIFERLEQFTKTFGGMNKSILLVKDVDTLCPKLSNKKGEDMSNIARISSQFTALLDKLQISDTRNIMIGTTSYIENLDSKIRRPGRLGREIFIRIPSEKQRQKIISVLLKRTGFEIYSTVLDEIIKRTQGYAGADLELLIHAIQRSVDRNPSNEMMNAVNECLQKMRPTSLRNSIGLISGLTDTLDSIGGMEKLKKTLRVSVLGPLQHPQAFRRFGLSPLKGILLYGPPGCAKTTIARCLAAESRMTFVSVSAAEVYSPYVGHAEKLITRLFNQARLSAPAVIFLDEIDSLVGNRSMQGVRSNDVHIRVLSTLLTEMDGIGVSLQSTVATSDDSKNILVIAASNRPDMIDGALLRPGRLSKLIHVPAPDEVGRLEILKKVSAKVPLAQDVCLQQLAKQTERYSGADLQNLCSQAALHGAALDENIQQVSMAHFQHVLEESGPSLTSKQIEWYFQYEAKHKVL